MSYRPLRWLTGAAVVAALVGGAHAETAPSPVPGSPVSGKHRGLCWVAGGAIDASNFAAVDAVAAGWVSQTPFGWMKAKDATEIGMATSGRVLWGETDAGLIRTHQLARERGLGSALKPHLWVRGAWPGAVEMADAAGWQLWFAQYERFLLHYAQLAATHDFDLLVIGTELKATTASHESEWRRLIAATRKIYPGPLTYAANWDEVGAVPFWDALDFIGVNAYFPLTDGSSPDTVANLVAGWQPAVRLLGDLAARTGKQVLLTEVGYRATRDCAVKPWEHEGVGTDERCQAQALEALFEALWEQQWLAGVYVWKWFPNAPDKDRRGTSFSPQGRAAERVLRKWFGSVASD